MIKLTVDPEFRDKIPALTDEEFNQLRENILSDGEVFEPLVVWNGTIIDGHNRYKIVQEHPEIPFHIKEMDFPDKWAAFAWMYKNQLGRRNIQAKDRDILIDGLVEARKHRESFKGNQYTKNGDDQSGHNQGSTRRSVAKELGVGEGTVQRAQQLGNGLRELEKVSPKAAKIYRTTNSNVPRSVIREIPKLEKSAVEEVAEAIIENKSEAIKKRLNKECREKIEMIRLSGERASDSSTHTEYTIEMFLDELSLNGDNYVSSLHNALVIRSTLLVGENRDKVSATLDYIIKKIEKERNRLK